MNILPKNWALYISNQCPFCRRVTDMLAAENISMTIIDAWKDDESVAALVQMSGKRTVPYLRMGDTGMHESLDIIERIKQEVS